MQVNEALDDPHVRYLAGHHQGRLATVAPDGTPQNKPVGYRYNSALGTIDIAGFNMDTSAKYRNIAVNPEVAFVVDDAIGEGAEGMRFIEVRGRAEQAQVDPPASEVGIFGHIIRIHPRRVVSWNADPDHPGFQTQNLVPKTGPEAPTPGRPKLEPDPATTEAAEAVAGLIAELQVGIDVHDADIYNRHFAADVIWGSPYGAIVQGYDELHAIHTHLLEQATGGPPSRYEVVQVVAPTPDVALAHVRRVALDPTGRPLPPAPEPGSGFSEMALYVVVRRGRDWWLAAGQNTPIA
jgi:pyridoxamine 5'-phosphate oxidase family protein